MLDHHKALIFFTLISLIVYVYFCIELNQHFLTLKNTLKIRKPETKLIILWTKFATKNHWGNRRYNDTNYFEKIRCPQTKCRILFPDQKHLYPETEYDAIVFNGYDVFGTVKLPERRLPSQIYVYMSREPPHPWWLKQLNFNVTYNLTRAYLL